jgi:serine/threonine protein kinase
LLNPDTYTPSNLRSELHLRGRLPAAECLRIGLALTTALEHLHKHGLVHRDIKPSNIVFVNGIPKLADIGLVARAEATISFVGTEGFLPPEGPGTRQADIYSLGKVLYEISTGHDRHQFPELPTNIVELPDRADCPS